MNPTDPNTDDTMDTLTAERDALANAAHYINCAIKEIEKLRQERDEARREVCNMNETGLRMNESDKKREAKRRGWDCYKNLSENA